MVASGSFVSTGTFNHVFPPCKYREQEYLVLNVPHKYNHEGNLENKSVPHDHYLSLESCTSSKIIGTTMDSI
jgi:hypothetical protein